MGEPEAADVALDAEELDRVRELCIAHGASIVLLFGSTLDPSGDSSDVDVAVEFTDSRPTDEGYASVLFGLHTTLEDELGRDVDLVDVHSLTPRLARIVFDEGLLVVGSDERRTTLERRLAGDEPSVEEARDRVAAAAARLRESVS